MLLDATALRHTAHLLGVDAGWLLEQHSWLLRAFDDLPGTGFSGPAAEAAIERLHLHARPLHEPPEQMLRAAQVLHVTARLQEELDAAARRAVLLAGQIAGASPLVALLLRDLHSLGELLDHVCARQIDLLCTPVAPAPARRLADTPDLGLGAVHELNQLTHHLDLPADVQVLEAGEGRLVAAVGDLENAASVVTIVAGTGSSDPQGLPVNLDRARTIAQATGGAAVLWLGYRAPAGVGQALAHEPARVAGAELQAFQRELTRRFPGQRRVVLGYSYGSLVAGRAASASGGLYADHLVFIGSPGVGVGTAAELTLLGDNPKVHAMTHPSDVITLVRGVHGTDPTSPEFGARVWPGDRSGDHGSYWDDPVLLSLLRGWTEPESADQKNPRASSE
ncbi:alpha/beta hydrolase [Corynebacterium sp.]|uniref:alpha/beta hydrolase n=1 Tax=Corynebacterium sp. TaxID=1720 RepID=UPI0026DF2D40|nr:alpha/beta hydrolase [Corynebacterium sp.]MDO5511898.1 alpha/beta hydrolase [Corynebacterium sp.]